MGYNTLPRRKWRKPNNIPSYSEISNDTRPSFIEACCGNGDRLYARNGSLKLFLDITENRMLDYERATAELFNVTWKPRADQPSLERQFEVSTKIIRLIRSSTAQTTIDDIVTQLFDSSETPVLGTKTHENTMRHFVFAVIGWSTLLYTPVFTTADADFKIAETQSNRSKEKQTIIPIEDSSQRPIGAMLRSYKLVPIACPQGAGLPQVLPNLLVTHLNVYSLSQLGGVTILWVNDLSKHCEFDRYSRKKQLKLFRLPSLCAEICLSEDNETLIDRLFKSHICRKNCQFNTDSVGKLYLAEVLLSYRLLFGQHSHSRKLFREKELKSAKWNGALDPLLGVLCGNKDVDDSTGIVELLHERNVYKVQDSFPHLGLRLAELADYISGQEPNDFLEVWKDQRNPDRLLTLKAAIKIGLATVILGILQVLLGIAQLAISIYK
ncbi:hypothetical protein F5Y00DRAFT_273876 [Daldinia vernicosa]|uniref:uncharacterized protein n=1 Tax=Daldinia vernicosa TaxID=114800 RepID=UPI002008835D|nr:uncharacterized protein F5Y00DRAFT_273876 [Daldinia vernicosa]KAI0844651.1 hypothetical protein F5Y00DRAFT_273876 [Daldinia vernicosa]